MITCYLIRRNLFQEVPADKLVFGAHMPLFYQDYTMELEKMPIQFIIN